MHNRLAQQRSPYLRQHASNPVDWYPWCPEALERARQLDRPIFLSIGYAACHWCHVMERECFENRDIAALLNEHFVSIKVDREERPDLDSLYMQSLQLLTREGGGWPLNVFLTPQLHPFYAGTYFPPDDRYAPHRPSFPRLLQAIITAWQTRRHEIEDLGQRVLGTLQQFQPSDQQLPPMLTEDLLRHAAQSLQRLVDPIHGGFGSAPKFPHAIEWSLLLRLAWRFQDHSLFSVIRHSLTAMARGGIHDHLGGGFARYSVDDHWRVPHFEKMLYDNALLATVYTEAALALEEPFFAATARSTLDYVLRDLAAPAGLFCSSEDADSEGEEGKFYLWTPEQIYQVLGAELGKFACQVWNVTPQGNFEGKNILHRTSSDAEEATRWNCSIEQFQKRLQQAREQLFQARQHRVRPGRDDKVITAWNAWMITALARAGSAWNLTAYLDAACTAANSLLRYARDEQGRLRRLAVLPGDTPCDSPPLAFLEDYAALADALTTLYEATGRYHYLQHAHELVDDLLRRFTDPNSGGFFFTAADQEPLPARLKETHDGATPSGNALATTALLRLSHLLQQPDLAQRAEQTLRTYARLLQEQPMAAGQFLIALDWHLGPVDQIAIIGRRHDQATQRVLSALHRQYHPRRVLAYHDPDEGAAPLPWFDNKVMVDNIVTVYRCRDFSCDSPLIGPEAVENAISAGSHT
jgi:uncharacterized protein YyaL (SSP411 family)